MIEHKPKPCKGINKAHGFKGCKTPSVNRKYGLCPSCLYDWMLTDERGKIYKAKVFQPKVEKKIEVNKRIEKKDQKEKLKSITKLVNEARVPFQKWIRKRDANLKCISCPSVDSEIWDGGHYFKAEIFTGLIFDERNVNKQCRKCNSFLGGNEIGYRKGLIERYGEGFVLNLESESDSLRSYKFNREELIDIKNKYQKLLRN